jgi:3-deoxy-manno-octulosonate cytidylyltransferase (CMP-KDO synthetase)
MKILAVIPARYASTRFPGKPLISIFGKTMIERVYEQAMRCRAYHKIIVATDDERIFNEVTRFGGTVEMTAVHHQSGTDRIAEVALRHPEFDVIVNVQGDQPFVSVESLNALVAPFHHATESRKPLPDITTVAAPLDMTSGYRDENTVKVLVNKHGNAIYFSRSPIPFFRTPVPNTPVYQHVGLYAFRRDALHTYAALPPSLLEAAESLEQLRALEHGYTVAVSLVDKPMPEINTPDDLAKILNSEFRS